MTKRKVLIVIAVGVYFLVGCQSQPDLPAATKELSGLNFDMPVATAELITDSMGDVPIIEPLLQPAPPADGSLFFRLDNENAGVVSEHQTILSREKDGSKMMGGGAVGDFNNDGWQDIFLLGGGFQPDRLFINQQNGQFVDRATESGLKLFHVGSGAAVADYDGDGWLDIYVTSFGDPADPQSGQHLLYHNNGDGTFVDRAKEAGVHQSSAVLADGFGATFGDYDLDGDLDLFVTGWRVNPELGKGNRLFRNEGDGTFSDVTEESGFIDNGIRGFSPCFADMDGDRFPELLLVADFGTSLYFVNNRNGSFSERTEKAEAGKEWSGMGLATGDFNNDGQLDWYATAIYGRGGDGRGEGNKLYINQGNHLFTEIAQAAGVDDGGWGWGAMGVDLDQDGWLDLVETNGWSDIPNYDHEITHVWLSNGDLTFTDVATKTGIVHTTDGLGIFYFDADEDGDQDFGVTSLNGPFHFYRNELAQENRHWLRVHLDTSDVAHLAPNGIGSRVMIQVGEEKQVRDILACPNYLSQSELTAHFGLGSEQTIDQLTVFWADGTETTVEDVAVNQTIQISAP